MFAINEYAAGLLVIVTIATLLFIACLVVLVFIEGVSIVAHASRKLKHDAIEPNGRWMRSESRES